MTLSALTALYRLERQGLLYVAEGVGEGVLSEDGAWPGLALSALGAESVAGPALTAAARLPSGASGESAWGLPATGQAARIELVVRLPDAPSGLIELGGWGTGVDTVSLEYAPGSGMLRAVVGAGVALQAPIDLHDGAFHQVGIDLGSDGRVSLLTDGVFTDADDAVPMPTIDAGVTLRVLVGASATAELVACAIAPARFDRARVTERASVLTGAFALSGSAALDGGPAATAIVVRRSVDRALIAVVAPAVDRSFSVPVPPGLYEILCVGPDGYLAQVIDQVSAEPVA